MGMFNYIEPHPLLLLPEDRLLDGWQSKNIEPNLLETYKITESGRMELRGSLVDFSGGLDFYTFGVPPHVAWVEYRAEFENGTLRSIRRTEPEVDHLLEFVIQVRQEIP